MGEILEKLQSEPFLPNYERGGIEEFVIKRDCIVLMNRQAIVYWSVVTITVVFAVLDSAYSRIKSDDYHNWKFEYSRVTIFNTTYSPNYELASFYQNASWFPIGWTFAVSDLLTVTVLAHITCQLKILQTFIRKMIVNSNKRMMQLHVGGVMCLFFEIILISYWGNEVTLESQNVLKACYDMEFYGADVRFQKGLILMMERSKRPITFTAGKFSALTLGTFIWIARTSYSYMMILRRVND
ncbi:hypothetical protein RI129_012908 [Pyrocoelia pectoralis]|uniref:Uncharacterized protein n=1 Tax=Pyrocoelia pectoralis TaxID=417401 RepID=A0AAN7V3G9_9COLE